MTSARRAITSSGTTDLGATNNYRYVNGTFITTPTSAYPSTITANGTYTGMESYGTATVNVPPNTTQMWSVPTSFTAPIIDLGSNHSYYAVTDIHQYIKNLSTSSTILPRGSNLITKECCSTVEYNTGYILQYGSSEYDPAITREFYDSIKLRQVAITLSMTSISKVTYSITLQGSVIKTGTLTSDGTSTCPLFNCQFLHANNYFYIIYDFQSGGGTKTTTYLTGFYFNGVNTVQKFSNAVSIQGTNSDVGNHVIVTNPSAGGAMPPVLLCFRKNMAAATATSTNSYATIVAQGNSLTMSSWSTVDDPTFWQNPGQSVYTWVGRDKDRVAAIPLVLQNHDSDEVLDQVMLRYNPYQDTLNWNITPLNISNFDINFQGRKLYMPSVPLYNLDLDWRYNVDADLQHMNDLPVVSATDGNCFILLKSGVAKTTGDYPITLDGVGLGQIDTDNYGIYINNCTPLNSTIVPSLHVSINGERSKWFNEYDDLEVERYLDQKNTYSNIFNQQSDFISDSLFTNENPLYINYYGTVRFPRVGSSKTIEDCGYIQVKSSATDAALGMFLKGMLTYPLDAVSRIQLMAQVPAKGGIRLWNTNTINKNITSSDYAELLLSVQNTGDAPQYKAATTWRQTRLVGAYFYIELYTYETALKLNSTNIKNYYTWTISHLSLYLDNTKIPQLQYIYF